jgi:dipeptidase D
MNTPTGQAIGLPNPASKFCVDQGYQLEIRSQNRAQVGYCLFPDGSECEEWAFYRGECAPGSAEPQDTPLPAATKEAPAQLPNPASQNCVDQGGTLSIETRPDGGQYGVCLFDDNRQCEEWALMRGECPVGGIKVTGYLTDAARFCAITGGTYAITGKSGAEDEQGTCTLPDGSQCDVWAYYEGTCDPTSAEAPTPTAVATASAAPSGAAKIVFDSNRGGDYRDLYVMGVDGSGLTRLTEGGAHNFAGPWSPDGTQIAYTSFGLTESDVSVINADGSGGTNLTDRPDASDGFPAWSPDGSQIAFTSRRDGNNEIYLMAADGSDLVRLTEDPADDFAPAWSPDGSRIAFVSDRDRDPGIYDLYLMDADGSGVTRLTDDEAIDYEPDWSPDGTQIAFRSHHDGPADIYVIGVDGSGLANLTGDPAGDPADDWAPAWSPGGDQIAFQTNRDGNWEIYTMGADGTDPANLTKDPADDQLPHWQPVVEAGTAWSTSGQAAIGVTADSVPLKDALADLAPQEVWQNFYNLTQIPRPSQHLEPVREFLVQFGQDLGLETSTDDAGNVIIRRPAAAGMEDRKGVILQAHMDMVAQKTPDKVHDFTKDPIEAYVEGEWVTADGTTLGADDGIGLAMALSILQSETLEAGPIEALFTVDEEYDMSGALGLQPGVLQGDILINLDWETEGSFCIGSAGGEYAQVQATYPEVDATEGMACYELRVAGLKGGHSGVDINLGRGHATKLLVRLLKDASQEDGLRLAGLSGGDANNAIPREASALVCVPESMKGGFLDRVEAFEDIFQQELVAVEPDLQVEAVPADPPAQVMEETAQGTLINILYATPQGVMRMSDAVPGLVETSTNMGIVQVAQGDVAGTCFMRSSVDTALDDLGQMVASVWELAGVDASFTDRFPGWQPDPDSRILALMQDTYQDLYGQKPEVEAVHAGLECGVIGANYPDLDMISIGPTLVDVHTPDERLEVASVQKVYDLLMATLEQVP